MNIKSICVFCGSSPGSKSTFELTARELGLIIALYKINLVYGGGQNGLMGAVADGALENGGKVTGIIPQHLVEREKGHKRLTELVVVGNMYERKRTMIDLADAFVVLPGGVGTLDETFEILTYKQLGIHNKPIILLDIENYWKNFDGILNTTVKFGFTSPNIKKLYKIVFSPNDVLSALN